MDLMLPARFLRFLQEDIGIPAAEIVTVKRLFSRLGKQYPEQGVSLLPMVLWQYGLVTLEQLDRVLDWLEAA